MTSRPFKVYTYQDSFATSAVGVGNQRRSCLFILLTMKVDEAEGNVEECTIMMASLRATYLFGQNMLEREGGNLP